jgi:hypothetical protein
LTLADGQRPDEGTVFPIITGDSLSGAFASLTGFDLGQGLYLRPVYTPTGVTLVTTQAGAGDADLNGVVNADDYLLTDRGFLVRSTGWGNGDFNHDGVVNISDFFLIDRAFATQGDAAAVPGLNAAAVPEPSSTIVVAAAGLLAVRRGRRRERPDFGQ